MDLQEGEILQITSEDHHWYPTLVICTEPKAWGCVAVCLIPSSNAPGSKADAAYIRLSNGQFEKTGGRAVVVPE